MRLRASDVREPSCRDAKKREGGGREAFSNKNKKDGGEGIICEAPRGTGESDKTCLLGITLTVTRTIGLAWH